jgi:long-chain acyl-CoA synthetase
VRGLAHSLAQQARLSGPTPALRHKSRGQWRSWSWEDLAVAVGRLAGGWAALGIGPGDRVLILAANRPRALWSVLAVQATGAIPLLVDPREAPGALAQLLGLVHVRFAYATNEEQVDAILDAAGAAAPERIVFEEPRGLVARHDARLVPCVALEAAPRVTLDERSALPLELARHVDGRWEISALGPERIRQAARRAGERAPLSVNDEALLVETLAGPASLLLTLGRWLEDGFLLSLGETVESVALDLHEVSPSYLAAGANFFGALQGSVAERLGPPRAVRRRLVGWAVRVANDSSAGRLGRALARLVLGPLARVLGLARVRQAVVAGEPSAEARALLAALGIELLPSPDEGRHVPLPVASFGAPAFSPLEELQKRAG